MENGLIFFISTITSHFYPRNKELHLFLCMAESEVGETEREREERGRKEGTEGESFNSLY